MARVSEFDFLKPTCICGKVIFEVMCLSSIPRLKILKWPNVSIKLTNHSKHLNMKSFCSRKKEQMLVGKNEVNSTIAGIFQTSSWRMPWFAKGDILPLWLPSVMRFPVSPRLTESKSIFMELIWEIPHFRLFHQQPPELRESCSLPRQKATMHPRHWEGTK